MNEIVIRPLASNDADSYRALRLRSLIEHPEAFGRSAEEWQARSLEQVAQGLRQGASGQQVFGAFLDGDLVGLVGFDRFSSAKTRHRGMVSQMYVAPEARRQGIGRLLLDAALAHARAQEGLEEVILAVTVGNTSAKAVYASVGFVTSHVEPCYIKLDGAYYHIEWMSLRL